jgi:hypothetical protein
LGRDAGAAPLELGKGRTRAAIRRREAAVHCLAGCLDAWVLREFSNTGRGLSLLVEHLRQVVQEVRGTSGESIWN